METGSSCRGSHCHVMATSSNRFLDRLAAVRDVDGPAAEVVNGDVRVDPEQIIDGRDHIAGRDGAVQRISGVLVGFANDTASLRAASKQQ